MGTVKWTKKVDRVCEEDDAWKPSIMSVSTIVIVRLVCALKITNTQKSLSDDLVVTCDEVVDTPKTASINS